MATGFALLLVVTWDVRCSFSSHPCLKRECYFNCLTWGCGVDLSYFLWLDIVLFWNMVVVGNWKVVVIVKSNPCWKLCRLLSSGISGLSSNFKIMLEYFKFYWSCLPAGYLWKRAWTLLGSRNFEVHRAPLWDWCLFLGVESRQQWGQCLCISVTAGVKGLWMGNAREWGKASCGSTTE